MALMNSNANDMLLEAAMKGELRAFKRAAYKLAKDQELAKAIASALDKNGNGALHFAAAGGHTSICRYLIDDLKFEADSVSHTGKTPMSYAASCGRVGTIEYLISREALAHLRASDGLNAVDNAIIDGHYKALRVLISSDTCDVNAKYITGGPLILATHFEEVQCMKILLEYNADPNQSCGCISPLVVSVSHNSMECVEVLRKAGADLNKISLFEWALDSKEMVLYLLKNGADPNIINELGRFPVQSAAVKGKKEIVDILFPLTVPFNGPIEWSIEGLFSYVDSENYRKKEKKRSKRRINRLKFEIKNALYRKEYCGASIISDIVLKENPNNVICKAIQSLCWNRFSSALTATSCISLDPPDPSSDNDSLPIADKAYHEFLIDLLDGRIPDDRIQHILKNAADVAKYRNSSQSHWHPISIGEPR